MLLFLDEVLLLLFFASVFIAISIYLYIRHPHFPPPFKRGRGEWGLERPSYAHLFCVLSLHQKDNRWDIRALWRFLKDIFLQEDISTETYRGARKLFITIAHNYWCSGITVNTFVVEQQRSIHLISHLSEMTQRYFLLFCQYNDSVIMNGLHTQEFQTYISKMN